MQQEQEQQPEPQQEQQQEQQEQQEATEQTQQAVDQMQENADKPTKDVGTFWNRLDVVFDKLIKGEEGPVNPVVQDVIDQFPSEDAFVEKNLRSVIYQPDKISLNSCDSKQYGPNPFSYASFRIRFAKPLLNVKSAELIRASFPTPLPTISDQECVFWYYRYANASVPTTVAGLSSTNLYFIRLQNSWIPPELVGTEYAYNRTFTSYEDLVTELNIAAARDPLSATFAANNLNYLAGDITFSYDTRMNKIIMTGNNSAYTYLSAGYNDQNIIDQDLYLLIYNTSFEYSTSTGADGTRLGTILGNGQNGYYIADILDPIIPGIVWTRGTLNSRLGFTWSGDSTTDSFTFNNLWRPSQSGSSVIQTTRQVYAQSYANLVNTACIYVYVDFVQGSSQDSQGNGGLLAVIPLNTSNNSVGYYDKVMSNDLLKIPSQLQEITLYLKDERLQDLQLPRSAIANLELGFTYY
jgi:hypothetical protein